MIWLIAKGTVLHCFFMLPCYVALADNVPHTAGAANDLIRPLSSTAFPYVAFIAFMSLTLQNINAEALVLPLAEEHSFQRIFPSLVLSLDAVTSDDSLECRRQQRHSVAHTPRRT